MERLLISGAAVTLLHIWISMLPSIPPQSLIDPPISQYPSNPSSGAQSTHFFMDFFQFSFIFLAQVILLLLTLTQCLPA